MTNPALEAFDSLEDLKATKAVVDRVIAHMAKLNSIAASERSANEKLWLLAFEASEARLAKMGSEQNEESNQQFVQSMFVLSGTIT